MLRFRNVRYRTAYPYGAGNTGSSTAMTGAATEYLHSGGQHQNPDFLPGYISRLPPRTREIRKHAAVVVGQHPLTPAHAGNKVPISLNFEKLTAHPRARGKYRVIVPIRPPLHRSPPRTREIRQATISLRRPFAAHPRARGKYRGRFILSPTGCRSPPRTREIQIRRRLEALLVPLTPAHAGNTASRHAMAFEQTAHPRARGKYHTYREGFHGNVRSPPRTRETRVSLNPESVSRSAHPRARGKYT